MDKRHRSREPLQSRHHSKWLYWSGSLLLIAAPCIHAQTFGCEPDGYSPTFSQAMDACNQEISQDAANGYIIWAPCSTHEGAGNTVFAMEASPNFPNMIGASIWRPFNCKSIYDLVLADGVSKSGEVSATKTLGEPDCGACVGDPINTATGNVYRREEEVQLGPWLRWVRYYNSAAPDDGNSPIGQHWTHTYQRALRYQAGSGDTPARVTWQREDGKVYAFEYQGGQWTGERDNTNTVSWQVDASNTPINWTVRRIDTNTSETYNAAGQLVRIIDAQGFMQQLACQNNRLSQISDAQGRSITLTSDAQGRIQNVVLPDGRSYRYAYDAAGNLSSVTYPDNTQQTYLYDEANHLGGSAAGHRLTGVVDPRGTRSDNYDYQPDGKAIATYTDGTINRHAIQYSADGSKATTTDPLGAVAIRTFSVIAGAPRITSLSGDRCQECGPVKTWVYDIAGQLSRTTGFNDWKTSHVFDPVSGLELSSSQDGGRQINTRWDTSRRIPLVRNNSYNNALYLAEQWQYNDRNQPLAYCTSNKGFDPKVYTCDANNTLPANGTMRRWSYTYCDSTGGNCPVLGLRLTATDSRGNATRYSYYTDTDISGCANGGACHYTGDLHQITNPLGQVTTILAYDVSGRVTRWQDANGIITDVSYTPRGWLAQQTVHAERDAATQLAYDNNGNLTQVIDPDGAVLHFTYDIADRLTDMQDGSGNRRRYTYDDAGNRLTEQVGDGSQLRNRLTRTFSNLGRLNTLMDGQGETLMTAQSYDNMGRLKTSTDAYGVKRELGYDALGRITSQYEDRGNSADPSTGNALTSFLYNGYDQVTSLTDPDNIKTTYDIDGFGQTTAVHSKDTGDTRNTFDAAGNLLTRTDARGITATYSYDALNRVTQIQYPDASQNVTLAYDDSNTITGCASSYAVGRLTRRTEGGVTTVYCYSAQGQVTQKRQVTQAGSDTTNYSYSPAGRLASLGYPSGIQLSYVRDSEGRTQQVNLTANGSTQPVVSNVRYQPFGPIASYTLGNGQTVTRSFDANDRVLSITSPAFNVQYGRDAMGNIITTSSNNAISGYLYDRLYRLTQVEDGNAHPLETYTYSKAGDRKSKTANGLATGTYGYTNHWLTSTGSEARTYDAAGNTTSNQVGGNTYNYAYDNANHLVQVQANGAVMADYTYNLNNERLSKTVGGNTDRYVYNEQSQLLGETGSLRRDYLWLDDLPIGVVDNGSTLNYVIADALNTPRVITDNSGATVWYWPIESNAFGEQQPVGSFTYNLRFPGQYYDAESGLFYNVHRYYDPLTGRYVQSDPLGLLAGVNTYGYVKSDPMSGIDPLGLNTYTIGANGALTFLGGGQGAVGIYFNPGKGCGEELDFGVYSSEGLAVGTNVGAGVVGGVLYGPASSLAGRTYDTNSSIGPAQGSFSVAPNGTMSWTAGWSIVGLPGGGSVSTTTTQTFGISDLRSMMWRSLNQAAAIGAAQHPQP